MTVDHPLGRTRFGGASRERLVGRHTEYPATDREGDRDRQEPHAATST
ncbi:hypothetical protein [Actinomadura sp. 6N118]